MSDTKTSVGKGQILLVGASIVALAASIWLPGLLQQDQLTGDIQLPVPNCLATDKDCRTQKDKLSIGMQLDTQRVRAATPLQFEVELGNIPAEAVMIDLQGRDMYMGINQVQLSPVPDKPGFWQGETELAVCTTGEMTWHASVVAATNKARITTQFEFKAK